MCTSPWVILNDLGGAFVMGAVGGGIWHSVKGAKNSPKVCNKDIFFFLKKGESSHYLVSIG